MATYGIHYVYLHIRIQLFMYIYVVHTGGYTLHLKTSRFTTVCNIKSLTHMKYACEEDFVMHWSPFPTRQAWLLWHGTFVVKLCKLFLKKITVLEKLDIEICVVC